MELDDGSVMLTPGEGKTVSFSGNRVRSIRGQPDGAYSVVEWVSEPGIRGTPRHIHMVTDEAFYVLEGTFGFRAGERTFEGAGGVRLRAQGTRARLLERGHDPGQDAHYDLPARLRALLRGVGRRPSGGRR
jgi:hypothetical protein